MMSICIDQRLPRMVRCHFVTTILALKTIWASLLPRFHLFPRTRTVVEPNKLNIRFWRFRSWPRWRRSSVEWVWCRTTRRTSGTPTTTSWPPSRRRSTSKAKSGEPRSETEFFLPSQRWIWIIFIVGEQIFRNGDFKRMCGAKDTSQDFNINNQYKWFHLVSLGTLKCETAHPFLNATSQNCHSGTLPFSFLRHKKRYSGKKTEEHF